MASAEETGIGGEETARPATGLAAALVRRVQPQHFRHQRLVEWIRASGGLSGRVLDLGCGSGLLAVRLARAFPGSIIYGCDRLADAAVREEARRVLAAYVRVDLNESPIPWPVGSFDAVVASDVLEHLENPSRVLREVHRVLQPGGVAWVTVPNPQNVRERIQFLLTGESSRFVDQEPHGHITMLTHQVLRSLVRGLFAVEAEAGDGFVLAGRTLPWLPGSRLWAYAVFYRLRALPAGGRAT